MCTKCDDLNKTIAHYRWVQGQIDDHGVREAADLLIAKLEADKATLHAER
jgi:hypothetical protein